MDETKPNQPAQFVPVKSPSENLSDPLVVAPVEIMNSGHDISMRTAVAVVFVTILVVTAGVMTFLYVQTNAPIETASVTSVSSTSGTQGQGLGAEIYQNTSNPLSSSMPEAQNPVANPIDNAYTNPF